MKYFNKPGLTCVLCLLLTGSALVTIAQSNGAYNWQLGFGVGYTNYYGDLSNYRLRGFKDFDKLYRFAAYNKNYQHQPAYSLLLNKKITPTVGFMIQANMMQFAMSDRYKNSNGSLDTAAMNYVRSLNFRTDLRDAGIAFTFNANNGKFFSKSAFFYPSIYIGAGVSTFTVKGNLYNQNGLPYNYRQTGDIMDGSYETNLRDLRTETDERYLNVEPYVDFGLGLHFRISKLVTLTLNSDIKYSASDYLDDVSRKYRTPYATPQEAYAARPGYNVVNPITLQRGDDNSVNDFYINNRLVLNISLGRKNTNTAFNSPVIYALYPAGNYAARRVNADLGITASRRDSLLKIKTDSLQAVKDSAARAAKDTAIQMQLQNITTDLSAIRNMLGMQQTNPRLQQLQYQIDSVSMLRSRLGQRPANTDDQLRSRIYQLQADSIRHEMEKVKATNQYPAAYDAMPRATQMPDQIINDALPEDSISNAELKTFNTDIRNLKKDKRYRSDKTYKSNVDSLQKKVNAYPVRKQPGNSNTKVPVRQVQPVRQPDQAVMETVKIDSVKQQDVQNNRSDNQAAVTIDTAVVTQTITDTVYYDQNLNALKSRLAQNSDSLAMMQQRLKASSDSAALLRRAAYEAANPVVEAPKKKWYQKIFRSKKKPETVEPENSGRQDISQTEQAPKKKWYQKIFGSKKKETVAPENNEIQNTQQTEQAPKKKWYQKIFGSKQKRQPEAVVVNTNAEQNRQQEYSEIQRRLKEAEDSSAYYRSALADAPASDQGSTPAPKKKWYQRIFRSDRKKQQPEVITNPDQRVVQQQNEAMEQQLKRSQDSVAYYRKALATYPEAEQPANAPKKKWYQKIFGSGKRKKQSKQQADTYPYQGQQQYVDRQQRYYNDEVTRLQRNIIDLNDRNRQMQDDYNRLQADREISRTRPASPQVIVTDRGYDNNRASDSRYNNELLAMRSELDRLKTQVNNNTQGGQDIIYQPAAPVVIQPQQAGMDTAQINALKTEIDQLRNELNAIRNKPVTADTIRTDHRFDAASFPVVSLYFNTGAVVLNRDQLNKIAPLAQVASRNTSSNIVLKGFTDPVGNAIANEALAKKRTAYVKGVLISRYKIDSSRIMSDEPSIGSNEKGKKANPLDRRVDMQFQ